MDLPADCSCRAGQYCSRRRRGRHQDQIPLGQWVEVGGVDGQQNQIFTEILSRDGETVVLSIALLVEKL